MTPVALTLNMASGALEPATSHVRRHLSDMQGMYTHSGAERALLRGEDPPIYEVLQYDVPNRTGQLERSGFNQRVIEQDGKPAIVPA